MNNVIIDLNVFCVLSKCKILVMTSILGLLFIILCIEFILRIIIYSLSMKVKVTKHVRVVIENTCPRCWGLRLNKPSKILIKILNVVEYIESNIQNIEVTRTDDPII